ncbi:aldo/keto reductase [Fructilactobacillus hinvesii]|uniref:Aldo/keto reductase n=1 Tax=Fructilactobacillus hinvesii TaxID=2940300 RepID=A0ABY5BSY9_9LACO|nr:aldo/keto reductase [Fructilactobacillus hinvesii]USS88239.1 aldo/keto reductase [Fructilactobacillus hinvesii]
MQTVKIGKSDVTTTPLGLGTNAVGGHNLFPHLHDETGIKIVKTALDNGISLLDTAFAYGLGRSEELIGQAIQDYDRSKIQIATKGGQKVTESGDVVVDDSPEHLKQCVEDSLKRLQTDYLDIFYIHFPDGKTPLYDAVAALQELKEAGKIKAIGVSNLSMDQLREANRDGYVDVDEEQYNPFARDAEQERFGYLQENQISFVPFFPLASGLLTGKYSEETKFEKDDIRHEDPNFQEPRFSQIIKAVDSLKPMAKEHDATVAQLVLAWYIKNPYVSVVIPGAKHPEQVLSNAKALQIDLTDDEYEAIDTNLR